MLTANKISALPGVLKSSYMCQQVRTTFVLRRRTPMMLSPLAEKAKAVKKLRVRQYEYEFVMNRNVQKQKPLSVILTDYVEGVGRKGDVIEMSPHKARYHLLLPKLAEYASPENIAKWDKIKKDEVWEISVAEHSSIYAEKTRRLLNMQVLGITMNMDQPWTIEPWHITTSLRKARFMCPESALTMPDKPISGPNLELQNKIFLVGVTINKKEKATLRCMIHHWTIDPDRQAKVAPTIRGYWNMKLEPVFPEDAEVLASLPEPPKHSLFKPKKELIEEEMASQLLPLHLRVKQPVTKYNKDPTELLCIDTYPLESVVEPEVKIDTK